MGDAVLSTLSPLLSNFSSSILEKIAITYGRYDFPYYFSKSRIAPIKEHLIRLARERHGSGRRLEVVIERTNKY